MLNIFDSIQRLGKFPADSSSVWDTKANAEAYVGNEFSNAHEGQIIFIKEAEYTGFYGVFKNTDGKLALLPLLNEDAVRKIAEEVAHIEMQHVFDDEGDHTGDASDTKSIIDTKIDTHIQDMLLTVVEGSGSEETGPKYALDGGDLDDPTE